MKKILIPIFLSFFVMTSYLFVSAQVCDNLGCVTDNYDWVEISKGFTAYYKQIINEATVWLGRDTSTLTGTFNAQSYHGTVTYQFSNGVLLSRSCQNGRVNVFRLNCPPGQTLSSPTPAVASTTTTGVDPEGYPCTPSQYFSWWSSCTPTDTTIYKCPSGYSALDGTTESSSPFSCYSIANRCSITSCPNGASNPPDCNTCPSGSNMTNGQCICTNGASNPPSCNTCSSTNSCMNNNICQCCNGASDNPTCVQCPAGSVLRNGQCVCPNGASNPPVCDTCPSGKVMYNGSCTDSCTLTNVCGQTSQGVMLNGTCVAGDGTNINNSCIKIFTTSTDKVNPNGSVDFSWRILPLRQGVRQNCGFVDLTTPTPRPIPGLQNLDPNLDRTRISNIQTTTRFCLVCQFFNTSNNSSLGDAVAHQWVRVIRVGEQ